MTPLAFGLWCGFCTAIGYTSGVFVTLFVLGVL